MNSPQRNGPHSEASWLIRLEKAEPYIALRLIVLQGGVAFAAAWSGAPQGEIPEILNFLPFSLGGVVREEIAFAFGYPIRELLWAGDYWRVLTGVFLPPGLGIFVLGSLIFFPVARELERSTGRGGGMTVYILGGATTLAVDLFHRPGVTSGGLGAVFAASGALWTLRRFEKRAGMAKPEGAPGEGIFFLAFLALICSLPGMAQPLLPVLLSQSFQTTLAPSWMGLAAAAVSGMAVIAPLASTRLPAAPEGASPDRNHRKPSSPGLSLAGALSWGLGLALYCFLSFRFGFGADYGLWKLESEVIAGNPVALQELENLAGHPTKDFFLLRRLSVACLRQGLWAKANPLLERLEQESSGWSESRGKSYVQRTLMAVNLNLQDSATRRSLRFSGASLNYQIDSQRLLLDRAHLARLSGDRESLASLREEAIAAAEALAYVSAIAGASAGEPYPPHQLEARILNDRAYIRAELGGDLEIALREASASVALAVDSMNLDTLGWIETLRGNGEEGIRRLQQALFSPRGTSLGATYYHLGVAHDEKAEREQARFYFEEALSRDLEWWEEVDLLRRAPDLNPEGLIRPKKGLDVGAVRE